MIDGGRVTRLVADKGLVLAALLAAAYVVVLAAVYASYPGYLDHGEPVVAAAAFKMLDGAQVYPPLSGSQFTSNIYGPYTYLANALFLSIFGGTYWSGKMSGLVALGLSIVAVYLIARDRPAQTRALGTFLFCALALAFMPFSIWNRPDPLLLLVAAMAVLVLRLDGDRWRRWVLLGMLGGVACGLKLYGPLFIAPLGLYLALRDRSLTAVAVMSAAGAFMVLLPFVLPVFSFEGYIGWFEMVAKKPTAGDLATKALRYGVAFMLPAVALLALRLQRLRAPAKILRDPEAVYAATSLLGMFLCGYAASKPGAGMYYLLPFAPIAVDAAGRVIAGIEPRHAGKMTALFAVLAVVVAATAVPVNKRFFRALDWSRTAALNEDLHEIMRQYPDKTIQAAIGSSIGGYHNTLQKTELIYAGHPYTIDFGVMIETSYLGIPVPQSVVARFETCSTDIWLVPKGEEPLTMSGYYGTKVTDAPMRAAFMRSYALTGSSNYFDVWACKRPEN